MQPNKTPPQQGCYCQGWNPCCQYPTRTCHPPNAPMTPTPPQQEAPPSQSPQNAETVPGYQHLRNEMVYQFGTVHWKMDNYFQVVMMRLDQIENSIKPNNCNGNCGENGVPDEQQRQNSGTVGEEMVGQVAPEAHIDPPEEVQEEDRINIEGPTTPTPVSSQASVPVVSDPATAPPASMSPASHNIDTTGGSNEYTLPEMIDQKLKTLITDPAIETGSIDNKPAVTNCVVPVAPVVKTPESSQKSKIVKEVESKSAPSKDNTRVKCRSASPKPVKPQQSTTSGKASSEGMPNPDDDPQTTDKAALKSTESVINKKQEAVSEPKESKPVNEILCGELDSDDISLSNIVTSEAATAEDHETSFEKQEPEPVVMVVSGETSSTRLLNDVSQTKLTTGEAASDKDKKHEVSSESQESKPVIVAIYANKPDGPIAVEESVEVAENSKKARKNAKKKTKTEEKKKKEKEQKYEALRISFIIEDSLCDYLKRHADIRKNIDYRALTETHGLWRRIARFVMFKRSANSAPPKNIKTFLHARHAKHKKDGEKNLSCLYLSLLSYESNQVVQEDAEFLSKHMDSIDDFEKSYLKLVCGENNENAVKDEEIPYFKTLDEYIETLPEEEKREMFAAYGAIVTSTNDYIAAQKKLREANSTVDRENFSKVQQILLQTEADMEIFEKDEDPRRYFKDRAATYALTSQRNYAIPFLYFSERDESVLNWDSFKLSRIKVDTEDDRVKIDTSYILLIMRKEYRK